MSDFAVERSFAQTAIAVKEHYGFEIPIYTINRELETVAKEAKAFNSQAPEAIKPATTLVSQVDGSMIPVIDFDENKKSQSPGNKGARADRRKLRKCIWKEIRVSTVSDPKLANSYYGVALGEAMIVGCMMHEICKFNGLTEKTKIHAVSDGAPWIADQYRLIFGSQCQFLLDIYHACEYLNTAVQHSGIETEKMKQWLKVQKNKLKESKSQQVIAALKELVPKDQSDEHQAFISSAITYLENRKDQLDYKLAIDEGLPIGSGEVESAHRHIIQQRLKISGAWWGLEKAEHIAQLRALRANGNWENLWLKKAA